MGLQGPCVLYHVLIFNNVSFLQSEKVALVSFREIKFLLRLIWHGIVRNLPYLLFNFVIPWAYFFVIEQIKVSNWCNPVSPNSKP